LADESRRRVEEERLADESRRRVEEERLADESRRRVEEERLADESRRRVEEERLADESRRKARVESTIGRTSSVCSDMLGDSVIALLPVPGLVIKTRNHSGTKVFVNLCSHPRVRVDCWSSFSEKRYSSSDDEIYDICCHEAFVQEAVEDESHEGKAADVSSPLSLSLPFLSPSLSPSLPLSLSLSNPF
jgi:hypothetical protein